MSTVCESILILANIFLSSSKLIKSAYSARGNFSTMNNGAQFVPLVFPCKKVLRQCISYTHIGLKS